MSARSQDSVSHRKVLGSSPPEPHSLLSQLSSLLPDLIGASQSHCLDGRRWVDAPARGQAAAIDDMKVGYRPEAVYDLDAPIERVGSFDVTLSQRRVDASERNVQ